MPQIPESANKGLEGIIAATSEISTIHDTTLLYRGYTIEDLSSHCGFEEVVYLLWNGRLPKATELDAFKKQIWENITLPADFLNVIEGVAKTTAHSMAKLRTT